MDGKLIVHGIILSSSQVGEADRRLVILSGEYGRITAFAKGARRQNSMLVGVRPFTYGEMVIYEGRTSNRLESISIENGFDALSKDLESSCYASYFTEFADYYAHEALEAREMVRLLYAAFNALSKNTIPRDLIKAAFELRIMAINGEYSELPLGADYKRLACADTVDYTWKYVIASPLEKLFGFTLKEEALSAFCAEVTSLKNRFIDKKFKSLEILESMK